MPSLDGFRAIYHLSLFRVQASNSPFTNADTLMFGCVAAMLLDRDYVAFVRGLASIVNWLYLTLISSSSDTEELTHTESTGLIGSLLILA